MSLYVCEREREKEREEREGETEREREREGETERNRVGKDRAQLLPLDCLSNKLCGRGNMLKMCCSLSLISLIDHTTRPLQAEERAVCRGARGHEARLSVIIRIIFSLFAHASGTRDAEALKPPQGIRLYDGSG